MNAEIRKLEPAGAEKFSELIDVYADVFEMDAFVKPPLDYLRALLEKEFVIVFVATLENAVIGGLTAYVLPSPYFESAEVYVYDLAVATEYQRQGVGAKLMRGIREHCAASGMKEVFLQADYEDEHAVDFYRKIGGAREDVIHFSFALESSKMP
jgi:aminoglycoside 3-N-acetyltransferase I